MKLASICCFGLLLVLLVAERSFGFWLVYRLAYGALVVMAASVTATFLWLWCRRATPLALGMVFTWSGAAGILGWWWLYQVLERPAAMTDNPVFFVFVALYLTGTVLHFSVIGTSFGRPQGSWIWPVAGAFALSLMVAVLF